MTVAARLLLGGLVGALLALVVHPASRPFVLIGLVGHAGDIGAEATTVPAPTDLQSAAMLLQAAAEREAMGRRLLTDEALAMAETAQRGAESEPDNAFWPQMEAVWIPRSLPSGEEGERGALRAWARASQATAWNDHQTQSLLNKVKSLEHFSGATMSWHYAVALSQRSWAVPSRIGAQAQSLLARHPSDIDLRVQTVLNGRLLRDGARSIVGATIGARLIESAALRQANVPLESASPRMSQDARNQMLSELREAGRLDELQPVSRAFASNDAWFAFVPKAGIESRRASLAQTSVACAVVPGSLLLVGMVGLFLFLLGLASDHWDLGRRASRPSLVAIVAGLIGLSVYFAFRLEIAAVWTTVVVASFCCHSSLVKSPPVTDLGRHFRFTVSVLGSIAGLSLAAWVASRNPVTSLLGDPAVIDQVFQPGFDRLLALSLICASLVVATAPLWGFIARYRPGDILPHTLRQAGLTMGLGGSLLAVLAVPVCVSVDRGVSQQFERWLLNEPNDALVR